MNDDTTASALTIDFCGERHACTPGRTFSVGRDADLSIDDNRYLHRRLLEFEWASGMWWMTNCGQSITVGVATADGTYQAMLGPAGRMPLVSSPLSVVFSAGPFTYELGVILDGSSANPAPDAALPVSTGADTALSATLGATTFTPSQRLLIIALCEPMLRDGMAGASRIPSSAEAAERLGWPKPQSVSGGRSRPSTANSITSATNSTATASQVCVAGSGSSPATASHAWSNTRSWHGW